MVKAFYEPQSFNSVFTRAYGASGNYSGVMIHNLFIDWLTND